MTDTGAKSSAGASTPSAAVAPAPPPNAAGAAVFYRYRDADGRLVIVDSLDRVPASARASVEHVALEAPPASAFALPEGLSTRDVHWPSFAAGAACALFAALVVFGLRRARVPLLRVALLGGLVLLGTGAYFGWLRRTTGQGGPLVQSPAALIDDARSAVQKMNARTREQERVLRELDAEP